MDLCIFSVFLILAFLAQKEIQGVKSCLVHQKFDKKDSKHRPRNEFPNCTCGFDYAEEPVQATDPNHPTVIPPRSLLPNFHSKSWQLHIHLFKHGVNLTSYPLRTCTGTSINNKIVLTSHNCLKIDDKPIPIYESWHPQPKNINGQPVLAKAENLLVAASPFYPPKYTLEVAEIVYNKKFILGALKKPNHPDDDIAIIVLKNGLNITEEGEAPICLPPPKGSHFLGYRGYYYGFGQIARGVAKSQPVPYFVGDFVILPGKLCDESNGLRDFSGNATLCVQHRTVQPPNAGGPLVMSSTGEVNLRGFAPNRTVFLMGIASVPKVIRPSTRTLTTTYFTNILPMIPFLEEYAAKVGASWCKTPKLELTPYRLKGDELKYEILRKYEWEVDEPIKRDESLDCVCGLHNLEAVGRIVGGVEATPHEFPWLVRLTLYWNLINEDIGQFKASVCGGSIINDRMILTAAHCTFGPRKMPEYTSEEALFEHIAIYARLHFFNARNDPDAIIIVGVKRVHSVKDYTRNTKQFTDLAVPDGDLVLLELKKPLEFSTAKEHGQQAAGDVRPICLPREGVKVPVEDKFATVAGWGVQPDPNDPASPNFPDTLFKINVRILPLYLCKDKSSEPTRDSVICAGNDFNPNSTVTQGDSGGPLNIRSDNGYWTQVGVVSYGQTESPPDDPSSHSISLEFYTDVQKYLRFIDYYSKKAGAKWCKNIATFT